MHDPYERHIHKLLGESMKTFSEELAELTNSSIAADDEYYAKSLEFIKEEPFFFVPTEDGLVRFRLNRTMDPRHYEQLAYDSHVEYYNFHNDTIVPLLHALHAFGPVTHDPEVFPSSSSSNCYFIGSGYDEGRLALGLGDAIRHKSNPNPGLFKQLRVAYQRQQRLLTKRDLLQKIFVGMLVSQELPTPRQAVNKFQSRGLIKVNDRQYEIYAQIKPEPRWIIEWPDDQRFSFVINLSRS